MLKINKVKIIVYHSVSNWQNNIFIWQNSKHGRSKDNLQIVYNIYICDKKIIQYKKDTFHVNRLKHYVEK